MGSYFTRERFRRPQFLAASILLAFLAQAAWLVYAEISVSQDIDSDEAIRIAEGLKQWRGRGIAGCPATESVNNPFLRFSQTIEGGHDSEHSPLLYLVSAVPLLASGHDFNAGSAIYWRWLTRLPFLACGVLMGASLWYVARRLCGNTGGLIALTLYGFSPSFIRSAAVWHTDPEIVAAWGAFGTIFTAIAVAHTLYAPREVVLWNWRRIVLLGVSLAISIGSRFSMIILLPIALAFLLYVAPVRRLAGVVIWITALIVGLSLFLAAYFFQFHAFRESMRHANLWRFNGQGFTTVGVYKQVALQLGTACPALAIILPVALATYCVWARTRYFGNSAPLLMAVLFTVLAIGNPQSAAGFLLASVPFLLTFVAGILADLLETRYRPVILASVVALLMTYMAWTLLALAQVPRG
jgi:4-amino-4-deoxy-L-arabinose transferase-like glycosyltransferase